MAQAVKAGRTSCFVPVLASCILTHVTRVTSSTKFFWLLQNKMDSHTFSVLPQILLLMYEVTLFESNFLLKAGPFSCPQREDRQWYVNQIAQ